MGKVAVKETAVSRLVDELKHYGGLTGRDIANILGVSPPTVTRWSKGESGPTIDKQTVMANLGDGEGDMSTDFVDIGQQIQFGDDGPAAAITSTGTTVTHESTEREIDPVSQTFREVWEFQELDPDGNVLLVEHEILNMRWGYRYEMPHLFELCGFDIVAEYGDTDRSPPMYGREQVWVLSKSQ